jgi:hypothetical protein
MTPLTFPALFRRTDYQNLPEELGSRWPEQGYAMFNATRRSSGSPSWPATSTPRRAPGAVSTQLHAMSVTISGMP